MDAQTPVYDSGSADEIEPVVLSTGAETNGGYAVVALSLPPHAGGFAPHTHPRHSEGCYVVAGTLAVTRGDETITLAQGGSILVPPGVQHRCWNPTAASTSILLVYRPGVSEAEAMALVYAGVRA